MSFPMWRGVVGLVKPTRRPGSLEEFIRIIPEGIGVVPILMNIKHDTEAEFREVLSKYKAAAAELAEHKVDLIRLGGTPPFMILGRKGEAELIREWEAELKTPLITDGQTHAAAMKALGITKFIGASYSTVQNKIVINYMQEAGFEIASMEAIDVPFHLVGQISPHQVYAHIKKLFLENKGANGIYIQGGGWRTAGIIELLERDLEVPVVHATLCQSWETQRRLNIREPISGYGRLLAELPR